MFAEPIEFPADTVMFVEAGCRQCDGPASGIYRVSRAGEGPVHVDLVLKPDVLADQMLIQRLKKRKLMLKDRIVQLENLLLPDIIA